MKYRWEANQWSSGNKIIVIKEKTNTRGGGKRKKCDLCVYGEYDTDAGDLICQISMDQDEYIRYQMTGAKHCPYFEWEDEYHLVRKQN